MNKILLTGVLLVAHVGATSAQQTPVTSKPAVAPAVAAFLEQVDATAAGRIGWAQFVEFRKQRFARTDENGDGVVDEDEYVNEYLGRLDARLEKARAGHVAQTRTRFNALDGNKDGIIDRAEFDAAGERTWEGYQKLLAEGEKRPAPPGMTSSDPMRMPTSHNGAGMLEIYDTNGDGNVDRTEFDAVRERMFADADRDKTGKLTFEDYLAEFEDRLDRRAASVRESSAQQARVRFNVLNTSKDGKLTFDEYQVSGKRMFDRADSNGDGVVDARDPEPTPLPSAAAGKPPANAKAADHSGHRQP